MKKVKRFYKLACKAEGIIARVFLVIIMVLIFSAAVARTLHHPLSWAMDLSTFLFAWTVFFSADTALRKNRHVNVQFFVSRLSERLQIYIGLFNYGVILIFLGYLFRYGIVLSYSTRFRTFQGIPGFSYMWVTISVPVGALFLAVTTIIKIWEILKNKEVSLFKLHSQKDASLKG